MIEVEIKARADIKAIADKLKKMGAAFEGMSEQRDVYYNAPHRDFAETDEAVRLRLQSGKAYLTYKGKKIDSASKTRKEIEVEVSDFAKAEDILLSLGFTKTLGVVKIRGVYRLGDIIVCLDDVDGAGTFVELETEARSIDDIPAIRDRLVGQMRALGVHGELIRDSYLEMLLAKKHK